MLAHTAHGPRVKPPQMTQTAIDIILAKAQELPSEATVTRELADMYPPRGNAVERRLARDLYRYFHAQVERVADTLTVRGPADFDLMTEIMHAAGQNIAMTKARNAAARRFYLARAIPIADVRDRWVKFVDGLLTLSPAEKRRLGKRIRKLRPETRLRRPMGKSLAKAFEPGELNEWRLANGQTELGIIVETLHATDIMDLIRPAMVAAATRSGRGTAAQLGAISFSLVDRDALQWLDDYTMNFSQRAAHGFEDEIKREVIRALDQNLSGRDLAVRLRDYIDPTTADGRRKPGNRIRYEADRIARTETHRAHHMGVVEAAAELGLQYFRWVTAGINIRTGAEVCWRCVPMEGKLIPIEEVKIGVGPMTEYPGLIPVHPNCRCKLVPVQHPEHLPQDEFMDGEALGTFRDSVADSDPSLHPFAQEARDVKAQTGEQQKRASRMKTITRQARRTSPGSPERAALQREKAQLKRDSRKHLEQRLEQFRERRDEVKQTVRAAREAAYA